MSLYNNLFIFPSAPLSLFLSMSSASQFSRLAITFTANNVAIINTAITIILQ